MARAATIADAALQSAPEDAFYLSKRQTARFFAEQLLPASQGLARVVKAGSASVAEARSALL
jgi:hypothetical protein